MLLALFCNLLEAHFKKKIRKDDITRGFLYSKLNVGKMTTDYNHTIRIATIPGLDAEKNPYLKLFYQGLRPYGIEVVAEGFLNRPWLRTNRDHVDLIHFHWGWDFSHFRFWKFAKQLPRFVAKLSLAKQLGYKIIWTVHNFHPHGRKNLALQYLMNLGLAQLSDGIFVNFSQAAYDVRRWFFKKRNVHLIPIGNYSPWYQNTVSKEEAREFLKVPFDAFVYLLFGSLRPNRGVESAVRAFQHIYNPESHDAQMLIVGSTWGGCETLEVQLQSQIGPYTNIQRINEFIPDDRVQYYFNAADIFVLPFRHIYTSSSAILALTFAKPVIAPRMGNLPELVHDKRIGILFEPGNIRSLAMAMKAMRERASHDDTEYLKQECSRYDWDAIWPQAAKVYREIVQR